jgi:SPP1 gp7 family putative phage head morphogenesis protein
MVRLVRRLWKRANEVAEAELRRTYPKIDKAALKAAISRVVTSSPHVATSMRVALQVDGAARRQLKALGVDVPQAQGDDRHKAAAQWALSIERLLLNAFVGGGKIDSATARLDKRRRRSLLARIVGAATYTERLLPGPSPEARTPQPDVETAMHAVFAKTRDPAEYLNAVRAEVLRLSAHTQQDLQTASGIEYYTWRTKRDNLVRSRHQELEGRIFRWDDPPMLEFPRYGNPGDDFGCRCVGVPVVGKEAIEHAAKVVNE